MQFNLVCPAASARQKPGAKQRLNDGIQKRKTDFIKHKESDDSGQLCLKADVSRSLCHIKCSEHATLMVAAFTYVEMDSRVLSKHKIATKKVSTM